MLKTTLWLCLIALLGLTPLQAQTCKIASSGIAAVSGGYTVSLPPQVASAVPTSGSLRLALRDAFGRVSAVAGPVRVLASGQLMIVTSERFSSSPQSCPSQASLQSLDLDDEDCFSAEHGIGCFLSWCAGQAYCLPGPGVGGFQCQCL